jgi:hypothetical protein
MPSASDISDTIQPGSLEYGERQAVAGRLQEALPTLQGGTSSSAVAPGAPAPGAPQDPMQRLLGGGFSSDLPVTDGLSLGPGAGPPTSSVAMAESPTIGKLRLIAMQASSPLLRHYARTALRRELQKGLNA